MTTNPSLFRRQIALLWTLFFVALASLWSGARAQEYLLGPRDVLSVTVLRHPELSAEKIEVDPGGRIRLPFVGSIVAAGKTASEVSGIVRRGLLKQLNDPTVTVTITQTRPRQVSVSGAVKTPGLFEIGPNWRISEAIAAAGGLTTSPETATATFSRTGSPAVSVNLLNVLRNSGSSENRPLRAGDNLRVIESTVPIRVAGEVAAPGALEVPRGTSIGDVIALAGGFTASASRAVTVTRKNGASGVINLSPGNTSDVRVQPGDLIVIKPSNDRVAVFGAVAKPGYQPLNAGAPLQLAQALADAGGLSPRAAGTRATLKRAGGQTVPLDLYALTVLGDESQNLRLQPGDVVNIPEASGVTIFGAVTKPGTYPLEAARNPRVTDLIIAAGGLSVPAAQAFIRIERAGGAGATDNVADGGFGGNDFGDYASGNAVGAAPNRAARIAVDALPSAPAPPRSLLDAMRDNAARNGTATPDLAAPGASVAGASTFGAPTVGTPVADAPFANTPFASAPTFGAPTFGTPTLGTSTLGVPTSVPVSARGGLNRNGANGNDASVLNARVYDGDRVTVEAIATIRVIVDGDVVRPDAFEVQPGTNLVDVLARAGGQNARADLTKVTLRHADGTSETVDVRDAVLFGAAAPPVELRNGDYIVVGSSNALIYVVGGVRNSEYYSVPPSGALTLGQSLSLAGGPTPGAQLNKIAVIRNTPAGVKRDEINLNQKKGDVLAANTPIRAGDVVYVPEANNSPSTFQKVLAAVTAFGAVNALR